MLRLTDKVKADCVLYDEQLDTGMGAVPTVFVSLAEYRAAAFLVAAGSVGEQDAVVYTILQALDANGGSAKAIGDPVTVGLSGDPIEFAVDVTADELDVDGGFAFVGLLLDAPNTINGTVFVARGEARYAPPA